MNVNYHITYLQAGKEHTKSFLNFLEEPHLKCEKAEADISLKVQATLPIQILSLRAEMSYRFRPSDRIFVNGFQSWTDSREYGVKEKMSQLSLFSRVLNPLYHFKQYGDYHIYMHSGRKGDFYGYACAYIRFGKGYDFFFSENENMAHTAISFSVSNNCINFIPDCEGLEFIGTRYLLNVRRIHGSKAQIKEYLKSLGPTPKAEPILGWTSWYNYYQNINEAIIEKNFNSFCEHFPKNSIFQIDDGFQTHVGDWLQIDKLKFPKGLTPIVEKIHQANHQAGLWLAPFAAEKKSELVQKHPHWILKDHRGRKVKGGHNWGGFYALDIYHPEFRVYLREVFHTVLKNWKFDMVKLDFLYAAAIIPRKGKTRAMIMADAMDLLRELLGEKKMLACGVPLGQAFHKSEYCRIGCDVGLDWNGKGYEKWLFRERVSTLNSIKNTIYRQIFDGSLFLNDPDVFLLRDDNLQLNREQRVTLFLINAIFGSLVFTSDDIAQYEDWQNHLLKRLPWLHQCQVQQIECDDDLLRFYFMHQQESFMGISNLSPEIREAICEDWKETDVFTGSFFEKNNNTLKPYQTLLYARQK